MDVFAGEGRNCASVGRFIELGCPRLVIRHSHKGVHSVARDAAGTHVHLVRNSLTRVDGEGWHALNVEAFGAGEAEAHSSGSHERPRDVAPIHSSHA